MNSSPLLDRKPKSGTDSNHIAIWLLDPGRILPLAALAAELLPPETLHAVTVPRETRLRRLWEGRQVALRLLLADILNVEARDIRIGKEGQGKPFLPDYPDLHFSVSSSDGWWLAGISDGPIGVDLEVLRPFADLQVVAQSYFNPTELAHLNSAPDPVERLRCFYRFWTRKEALLKLKGQGISGLSALREREVQGVWLEELALQEGLSASLALPKAPARISRYTWRGGPAAGSRPQAVEVRVRPQSAWLSEVGEHEAERLRMQDSLFLPLELPTILDAFPPSGCFVDFGSGVGVMADAVAAARPEGMVHRYDGDSLAVEKSKELFGGRPNVRFGCRGIEQGPPEGFSGADAAVMHLVLMHSPDPIGLLREVKRWMKPGGILHVMEPDDRALAFDPLPEWIPELLELMERVQNFKGGSRRLGRDLPILLGNSGWDLLGMRENSLDPGVAVAAVSKVFLPVGEIYLNEARQLGIFQESAVRRLRSLVEELKIEKSALRKIRVPLFHAWAQVG